MNPPAFPHPPKAPEENPEDCAGMTLRDYFAAKVLQGLIASSPASFQTPADSLATISFGLADAMLKARNQE
jgi:hypothetical protein